MITKQALDALRRFDGQGARMLSVYLDLSPQRQVQRTYRIAFEDLVHTLREQLDERDREMLSEETQSVLRWLDENEPQGKGLAIFSCTPREFWQAHFLPVRVRDHIAYEPEPDLAPLFEIMDDYERYAVALVNKERARLFLIFMGGIEESDALKDLVPARHDKGGPGEGKHRQRHHEAHVFEHLKRVAQRLAELYRERRFDRLILAGPEEVTTELHRVLPRALAARVVAVLPAEIYASEAEILQRTLEVEERIEREQEARLLDQIVDTANAGGRAVYGVIPTLDALWMGDVQLLAVAADLQMAGAECPSCGRLAPGEPQACSICGTAMQPVHDLIDRAIERAEEQDGRVEAVHGDAARRLIEIGGGFGALLRYRVPAADLSAAGQPA